VTTWTYYLLELDSRVVGWQRVNGTRVEYIGLLGDRWSEVEIPYSDRVRLREPPLGVEYFKGADDGEAKSAGHRRD